MNAARVFHQDGSQPAAGQVFVFGSNLAGLHAGGAALAAFRFYGAEPGVSEGRAGNSYAIPTVNERVSGALLVPAIRAFVDRFLHYAATHPEDAFFVTRIGCGIAGHKDADIAPMFRDAPLNCSLPDTWREHVEAVTS